MKGADDDENGIRLEKEHVITTTETQTEQQKMQSVSDQKQNWKLNSHIGRRTTNMGLVGGKRGRGGKDERRRRGDEMKEKEEIEER
ncbi:hypothetical protein Bpfe_024834 [Biomphalaria pfeifferi]|uniref:Uncharacterized protein n=1 Tax=Biomphalaria pfeifferi TaxID=112525 RepID=A0AAD8F0C7_BIOPF|nr:hypothetical protein Bpfe_024834 [Biomphalaria pfeifferi]